MDIRIRRALIALLTLATAFLPAVGRAAVYEVRVGSNYFTPSVLRASSGDTVRWQLAEGGHNVVAYAGAAFNSGTMGSSNPTYIQTFAGGSAYYRCTFHSSVSAGGICSGQCGLITDKPLTAPTVPTIVSPSDGTTVGANPVPVSGTAEPVTEVSIFEGGVLKGRALSKADGTWSLPITFESTGAHTLVAKTNYPQGALSDPSSSVTFDVTVSAPDVSAPYVAIVLDRYTFATGPVVIKGEARDNISVASVRFTLTDLLGRSISYQATCARCPATLAYWTATPTGLLPGRYDVRAEATDTSGNKGYSSLIQIVVIGPN